jgi:hypothetical protein
MSIWVASSQLPASVMREVKVAGEILGLAIKDWNGGFADDESSVLIAGIERGERRIPNDLIKLLDAKPTLRVIICTPEPLVKQPVVLSNGRIVVLGPPTDRGHVIAALRIMQSPTQINPDRQAHFEVLRRTHWLGWSRGADGPLLELDEQRGTSVGIAVPSGKFLSIASAIASDTLDVNEFAEMLDTAAPSAAIVHLTHDVSEWLIFWPPRQSSLWLCSANRIPTRWQAFPIEPNGWRCLRMPACAGDQLIGVWSNEISDSALQALWIAANDNGVATLSALQSIVVSHPAVSGFVVEVRR